jgi:endoplasmic reticulum Man9GlcNAc2 1,2-alpha-mannosidase
VPGLCHALTGCLDGCCRPTGVPLGTINLKRGYAHNSDVPGSSISEVATLQLEFQYLSYHTGNMSYANAVDKVMRVLEVGVAL